MAKVTINDKVFDIEAAIFDKDGTLIEFDFLWGSRTDAAVKKLVKHIKGSTHLERAIFSALGYDPDSGKTISDGPLAVASTAKVYTIAASVMYQHGISWEEADQAAQEQLSSVLMAPLSAGELRPKGDVAGLFQRLSAANVRIVVATSDDKSATVQTLSLLGVSDLVDMLICGDDDLPNKPSPEGIELTSQSFGVEPGKMMMVGDTISDMMFGRNAGVVCRVAVYDGVENGRKLAKHADVLIQSLDEIEVTGGA